MFRSGRGFALGAPTVLALVAGLAIAGSGDASGGEVAGVLGDQLSGSDEPRGSAQGPITIAPEAEGRLRSCCSSLEADAALAPGQLAPSEYQPVDVPEGRFVDEAAWERLKEAVRFAPDLPRGRALGLERGDGGFGAGPAESGAADAVAPEPRVPRLKKNFDGLTRGTASHRTFIFFPPDTIVAPGRRAILQATNSALRLTNPRGKNEVVQSLNDHFGIAGPPFVFDPKVLFDFDSERFFVVALTMSEADKESFIHVSVSRSDNPATLDAPQDWCNYRIKSKRGGSWADFPGLGINSDWAAISVNNFRFNGNFKAPFIYAIDKAPLVDNAAPAGIDDEDELADSCPALDFFRFRAKRDGDRDLAFTIQPAQHYDDSASDLDGNPLFFVSSQFGSSDQYVLWRLTSPSDGGAESRVAGLLAEMGAGESQDATAARAAKPSLSVINLEGERYSLPPDGEQPGGGLPLDTSDNRVQQTAFRDGIVWAVFATGCSFDALPNESCVRAVSILPDGDTGAVVFEETFGAGDDWFVWMPGVAINKRGNVLVPFQIASEADGEHLGTAFNGMRVTDAEFSRIRFLRHGDCRLSNVGSGGGENRTGDYVGAHADPRRARQFWIGGEYTGTVEELGTCDWRTRVGRVKF